MATLSRVGMNRARHKEGLYAKQREEAKHKEIEWTIKNKEISKEEHEERLKKLKEIGLIKENE